MSINPVTQYPGKVAPATPDNPFGTARNITIPGDGTGTPWESALLKDEWALHHAMLLNAGMEPNGTPDSAENSQLFKAAKASIGNGANLLSNHNFLIASPDDSQPPPDATPRSYPPGFQIFSNVFANETTGITDLTYIDGHPDWSAGDFYMPVSNTGAIERLTEFVASVADFDGKPRTRGVSYTLVGDEYRVTVGVDALEDTGGNPTPLGSVKFEQGSVATGHEVDDSVKSQVVGYKKFGETFGGYITEPDTQVELGKIYLNLILTDENYGSYLYFDAPEMPVSPVDYSASYGGTVKNGVFASTDRDAVNKQTLYGYRAGFDSTSTFCTYIGQQAGEGTVDVKDATDTGGSVAVGLIAMFQALSRSTVGVGLEAGNQGDSDNSVFVGSYAGGAKTGDKSVAIGYQSQYQASCLESVSIGHQSLVSSTGDKCTAVGAFSQNSSTGGETCSYGHRSLSANSGLTNCAYGNWSGFVTGGHSANNGCYFGYEAGRESDADGVVAVGRSACENNTGSFVTAVGYLTGQGNAHSRVTLLGQGAVATGVDQLQLGSASTTSYSFGPVQDRSDIRDKMDAKPLSDAHIDFFMEVEWKQYKMNYRDLYFDEEVGEDGRINKVAVENDGSRSGERYHIGAIAQQVEEAMNKHGIDFAGLQHHSVNGGDDVYTIGYQEFIGIQGEITQRHQRKISSLEDRLTAAGL